MNKAMTIKNRANKSCHRLTREIRKKFIGEVTPEETLRSDFRVVLYSHDTMGIGHMRRNLLIANEIKRSFPRASVLLIAGAKEASIFSQNAGIDCLTLPAFLKKPDGTYTSRTLEISVNDVLDFRSRTILAAIQSFNPDLFIVDKVPAGAGGELLPSFDWLHENSSCSCVLGIRDILDTRENVRRDWEGTHTPDVIREHFESIWIYGDPMVFDAVKEYGLAEDIANRVSFTGYLNTESRLDNLTQLPYQIHIPYVLCTVGGGQDGMMLSMKFIDAIERTGHNSVLLTGPFMPAPEQQEIHNRASSIPSLKVVEFADEGDLLIKNASHVVTMGGYNTISAILTYQKTALVVPRVTPREEQLLRANRLAKLGLVSTQHPNAVSGESIATWLSAEPNSRRIPTHSLNMNGLDRISQIVRNQFPSITAKYQQESDNHVDSTNGSY